MTDQSHLCLPQMLDVEAQPYWWRPYFMRQGGPGYRSASLNTDRHGFRLSTSSQGRVGIDDLWNWSGKRGVVLGNSTIYGVGTSCDGTTVPSWLNQWLGSAGWLWVNLGVRASVLWQERQVMELYLNERVDTLVWVSGINDLVAHVLGGGDDYLPPFIGEPFYCQRMNGIWCNKRHFYGEGIDEDLLCKMIRKVFFPLSAFVESGVKIVFVLQPFWSWLNRGWCKEERYLIDKFDARSKNMGCAHRVISAGNVHLFFNSLLRDVCNDSGISFLDANKDLHFGRGGLIFCDRIHLLDRGSMRLARLLVRHIL